MLSAEINNWADFLEKKIKEKNFLNTAHSIKL